MNNEHDISPDVVDAVRRTHAYVVDLFLNPESSRPDVLVEDVGAERDVLLWVRKSGATPSPRPDDHVADIHVYEQDSEERRPVEFQLFADGSESDFTVEAHLAPDGTVEIHDIHVL